MRISSIEASPGSQVAMQWEAMTRIPVSQVGSSTMRLAHGRLPALRERCEGRPLPSFQQLGCRLARSHSEAQFAAGENGGVPWCRPVDTKDDVQVSNSPGPPWPGIGATFVTAQQSPVLRQWLTALDIFNWQNIDRTDLFAFTSRGLRHRMAGIAPQWRDAGCFQQWCDALARLAAWTTELAPEERIPADGIALLQQYEIETMIGFCEHYGITLASLIDYLHVEKQALLDPSWYGDIVIMQNLSKGNPVTLAHVLVWSDCCSDAPANHEDKLRFCQQYGLNLGSFSGVITHYGGLSAKGEKKLRGKLISPYLAKART